jgi:hypothetical protein
MSAWTDQDIAKLKLMVSHGAPWNVIAKALKRTRAAVINRAWRMGLTMPADIVAERRGEVLARLNRSPEQRQRVSERRRAALAWCKPEWRPVYDKMTRSSGYSAAEAREIIEASHAR